MPRKEVNTALASNQNIPVVEPKAPSKNIAGSPVYYPPGQELFAKSEAQAAWRAQVSKNKRSFHVFISLYGIFSKIHLKLNDKLTKNSSISLHFYELKGGYAKGSGKYEYEAESKSKSASKSGAAVVPVCLPLCCAMPCSIM